MRFKGFTKHIQSGWEGPFITLIGEIHKIYRYDKILFYLDSRSSFVLNSKLMHSSLVKTDCKPLPRC